VGRARNGLLGEVGWSLISGDASGESRLYVLLGN
jgi:hypothetical protein